MTFFEVSSKSGLNVHQFFQNLTTQLENKISLYEEKITSIIEKSPQTIQIAENSLKLEIDQKNKEISEELAMEREI